MKIFLIILVAFFLVWLICGALAYLMMNFFVRQKGDKPFIFKPPLDYFKMGPVGLFVAITMIIMSKIVEIGRRDNRS